MTFDGPGPFDGDPVFNYLDQVVSQPPSALRDALAGAFREVMLGGAVRHLPPELASMLGMDPARLPAAHVDVDEGTWAWACAEMVALALGEEPETPMPEPFRSAASSVPRPWELVGDALAALEVVSDPARSELAGLLQHEGGAGSRRRILALRRTLERRRGDTPSPST